MIFKNRHKILTHLTSKQSQIIDNVKQSLNTDKRVLKPFMQGQYDKEHIHANNKQCDVMVVVESPGGPVYRFKLELNGAKWKET